MRRIFLVIAIMSFAFFCEAQSWRLRGEVFSPYSMSDTSSIVVERTITRLIFKDDMIPKIAKKKVERFFLLTRLNPEYQKFKVYRLKIKRDCLNRKKWWIEGVLIDIEE